MSSTNRGAVRNDADFYITPDIAIENFLNHFELQGPHILEPCAGNGAIAKAVRRFN